MSTRQKLVLWIIKVGAVAPKHTDALDGLTFTSEKLQRRRQGLVAIRRITAPNAVADIDRQESCIRPKRNRHITINEIAAHSTIEGATLALSGPIGGGIVCSHKELTHPQFHKGGLKAVSSKLTTAIRLQEDHRLAIVQDDLSVETAERVDGVRLALQNVSSP